MERLIVYIADNVESLFSASSISKYTRWRN